MKNVGTQLFQLVGMLCKRNSFIKLHICICFPCEQHQQHGMVAIKQQRAEKEGEEEVDN